MPFQMKDSALILDVVSSEISVKYIALGSVYPESPYPSLRSMEGIEQRFKTKQQVSILSPELAQLLRAYISLSSNFYKLFLWLNVLFVLYFFILDGERGLRAAPFLSEEAKVFVAGMTLLDCKAHRWIWISKLAFGTSR
jgi:hypothetical protein